VVKIETSSTMTFLEKEILMSLHNLFFKGKKEIYKNCIINNNETLGKTFLKR